MSTVRQQLAEVYARIPRLQCKGLCQECCGPVRVTEAELDLMEQAAWPKRHGFHLSTGNCTILNARSGKCDCYSDRPLVCRMWGAIPELECPYGCQPERMLGAREAYDLILQVEAIGGDEVIPGPMVNGRLATQDECDTVAARAEDLIASGFRSPNRWETTKPYVICPTCQWRGQTIDIADLPKMVGRVCPRCQECQVRVAVEGDRKLFVPGGDGKSLLARLMKML
jgi:Fe-S-cluster containining protein